MSRPGARGRPVKRPLGAGDYVQQMRRAGDAPDAPWQLMLSQARSHLLCGKLRDRAGMLRRAAALTSQDIATAMTGLRRQILYLRSSCVVESPGLGVAGDGERGRAVLGRPTIMVAARLPPVTSQSAPANPASAKHQFSADERVWPGTGVLCCPDLPR